MRRSGDGKPSKRDRCAHRALMETHIGPAGLASRRERELVGVGGKVTDAVQRRGRPMGDHPLLWRPFPGGHVRRELEPRGPQLEVIRHGGTGEVVHAVGDPLEDGTIREALDGRRGHPRPLRLLAGDEAPLVLGKRGEASDRRCTHGVLLHNSSFLTPNAGSR